MEIYYCYALWPEFFSFVEKLCYFPKMNAIFGLLKVGQKKFDENNLPIIFINEHIFTPLNLVSLKPYNRMLEGVSKRSKLTNGRFTTISSHFFGHLIYLFLFFKN